MISDRPYNICNISLFDALTHVFKCVTLFRSLKFSDRFNIKWIRARNDRESLFVRRWEILKASVSGSINAPLLFLVPGSAQLAVSLSFSLFCEKKSWSYEQIPFSSGSYLEELYRLTESMLFRPFCFPHLSLRWLFSLDYYFMLTAALNFPVNAVNT